MGLEGQPVTDAVTHPLRWGAFVPQGWKLEYQGWSAADAWTPQRGARPARPRRAGYDHLWVYDHVETVPRREATHCFEAFTMLAALSQVTERAELGQMVTCASYRNVGLLAKEAACVDVFSGGRLILGIGAGWYEREYQAYDYEFKTGRERLRVLDEALQVIPRLWRDETVDFDGTYLHFDGAYCDPEAGAVPAPADLGGRGRRAGDAAHRRAARRRHQLAGRARRRSSASPRSSPSTAGRSVGTSPPSCARTGPTAGCSTPRRTCRPGSTVPTADRCGVAATRRSTCGTTSSAPSSRSPRRSRRFVDAGLLGVRPLVP